MNQIDDEIIHLIAKEGNMVVVATIDALGMPNISPRYVMAILGDRIVFADAYRNKTFTNIKRWPKVTVAIVDKINRGGFQLKGDVEEVTDSGLISECTKKLKDLKFDAESVSVWALIVKEIYSIKPSKSSKLPLFSAYG